MREVTTTTAYTGDLTSIIFAVIVILIIAYGIVIKPLLNRKFISTAKTNGCVTTGTLINNRVTINIAPVVNKVSGMKTRDRHNSDNRTTKVEAEYQYTVNGQTYHKTTTFSKGGYGHIDIPGQVTVYYDKDNPNKAVIQK